MPETHLSVLMEKNKVLQRMEMVYSSLWLVGNWTLNWRMKDSEQNSGLVTMPFLECRNLLFLEEEKAETVSTEKISATEVTANPEWLLQSEPVKFLSTVLPRSHRYIKSDFPFRICQ